ncbi:hypothetical protein B566_EDAN016428 [Ephemera danica]|nr:hypothetical protein B566_EDAN016428 [Ephemera danica]
MVDLGGKFYYFEMNVALTRIFGHLEATAHRKDRLFGHRLGSKLFLRIGILKNQTI